MKAGRIDILTNSPYTLDQIALASFVPNIRQPHQEAETPYTVQLADYDVQPDGAFDLLCEKGSNSHLRLAVSKLASVFASRESGGSVRITAQKGSIYSLKQPRKLFQQIVFGETPEAEDMQRWLEDCKLQKQVPRFVVGYRTFTDGSLAVDSKRNTDVGADITVPVGAMAGDIAGLADVGMGAGHRSETSGAGGMSAEGERIYAICYRKVDLSYRKGKLASSLALDNAWEAYAVPRGDSADEELEDPFVQAELQTADDNGGGTTYSAEVLEGGESSGLVELFALLEDS